MLYPAMAKKPMKGVVFTHLIDFVADRYSADCVDDMIDASDVPNGGAYTSVGTYDVKDMQALIVALSRLTHQSVPDLLRDFGSYLCDQFVIGFPHFFGAHTNLFDFIECVDNHVHVEVRKLYPDAELPKFTINARTERRLDLDYQSCRPLEDLAEGMILAAAKHYSQPIDLGKARIEHADEHFVRFKIQCVQTS